tara:strand:- start:233427 stop:234077 length:651 start_codon:yes stop_codon:yes gene_type:complete
MALLNQPTQVHNQLEKLFETLRQGQAPDKFTRQFLKDIGFKSSNHHTFIPLLKGLGFLTEDGSPTDRYKAFLDKTRWRKVLAEAIREAYGDIFILKSKPTNDDKDLIAGKFKSTFNVSELVADRSAKTFLALLELADPETLYGYEAEALPSKSPKVVKVEPTLSSEADDHIQPFAKKAPAEVSMGMHYNIQIHLPPTKDIEVYNAIFKSLREHLVE